MARPVWMATLVAWAVLGASIPAFASTLELVSRADPAFVSESAMGESAPATGHGASADGRYWVFTSTARNLVAGQVDRNGASDVFLYDRVAGAVTLVSRAAGTPATTGGAVSQNPVVSADGRFVAFESRATDLIAGQVPVVQPNSQIFLWDRLTQATVLVSHGVASDKTPGNLYSATPRVSADGSYVAYASYASDLVSGQVDSVQSPDIFVYERASRGNALVSRAAGTSTTATGNSWDGVEISDDGRHVAFTSYATNLVTGQVDIFNTADFFVFDRVTGGMTLVSHAASSATRAVGGGWGLWSADGRYLAFGSAAPDLVAGQSGEEAGNVFLWDRVTNVSILASHSAAGPAATLFADSEVSAISSDGRFVVFAYRGAYSDIHLFDRTTGEVILVSHAPGSPATYGNGFSGLGAVSDDGRFVAFTSQATNLVAGVQENNDGNDAFLYDRTTGTVSLVSRRRGSASQTGNGESGSRLEISRDGLWIGFASTASDLTDRVDGNGASDFLLFDRAAGSHRIASLRDPGLTSLSALADSTSQAVSADGRWVVFESADPHIVPGQEVPPGSLGLGYTPGNLFLVDRLTRTARLVSHAPGSSTLTGDGGGSSGGVLSADGRWVAFVSPAINLTSPPLAPLNLWQDASQLYLFDRSTGAVTLVSRSVEPGRDHSNGNARGLALSADGRFLAFVSDATDLLSGFGYPSGFNHQNVYLFDRVAGLLTLVTRSVADPALAVGFEIGFFLSLSADGRYLAFDSTGTSLVFGQVDTQGTADVFLFDRMTGTRKLVSHTPFSPTTAANFGSFSPQISADGRVVAFLSGSSNLTPAAVSVDNPQLYLYDGGSGAVALASHVDGNPDAPLGFRVSRADLSGDGRFATFSGEYAYLKDQIYLSDRQSPHLTLVSHAASSPAVASDEQSAQPRISGDGRYVTFVSRASNLVSGQGGSWLQNVFLFDRQSGVSTLVSRRAGTVAQSGSGDSEGPLVSADGTTVVFASTAGDLTGDEFDDQKDVFLFRRDTRPGAFFTVPPCRLLDTRAAGQGPAVASAAPVAWGVYATCGVPSTARALSVNVTIVAPTGAGFLTLYAGDQALPATSTINFRAGQVRANNAVVPLAVGGDGTLSAYAEIAGGGTVHVVLDVNGYFE